MPRIVYMQPTSFRDKKQSNPRFPKETLEETKSIDESITSKLKKDT